MSGELEQFDEGQRELDIRLGLGMFASAQQLEHLISITRQVELDAGQVLYTKGAPASQVVQVISGQVELRASTSTAWTISAGIAGLIDVLLGRPYARTAVTTTASRILELDAIDYLEYLEDNFDVTHRILARASSELGTQLVALTDVTSAFSFEPDGAPSSRFANVELSLLERIILLTHMPVFANVSMQALATLGQRAVEVRFAAGEMIAPAGQRSGVVSVLVQGAVDLALPGGRVARRTGPALLAHVEELADTPRITSAVAATPVIALQVDREEMLDQVEDHFDLARALLRYLAANQDAIEDVAVSAGLSLGLGWK
ncbi:MAG: cyclic nucleotide-binding domain-containing protein [Kofleriaceae bacterium]